MPSDSAPRIVCVVTGGRADYGLLVPLLNELNADPAFRLRIVACGAHTAPAFGMTVREMEADGFPPDETIEALLAADTPTAVCKSTGLTLAAFGDVYRRLSPDVVVVLGDRYEIFAAAVAALTCGVPLAHIAGGQLTFGAVDDSLRHAITKTAHLHFTAAEPYRRRIIQLGEPPDRVFTVGALGLDNIRTTTLAARDSLEREIGFRFGPGAVLATYHPETIDSAASEAGLTAMLTAMDARPDLRILFTQPNADAGGWAVRKRIEDFVSARPDKRCMAASLGRRLYLSSLAQVDAVIGNSSSGVIEAPSFTVPTVNIGSRQEGRLRAASVLDCPPDAVAVAAALDRALSPDFRRSLQGMSNPLGDGRAAGRIAHVLKTVPLAGLIRKRFYDASFSFAEPASPTDRPDDAAATDDGTTA